jgi:hypothetical protein
LKVGTDGCGGGGRELSLSVGKVVGLSVTTLLEGASGEGGFFGRLLVGEVSSDGFMTGSETKLGTGLLGSFDWISSERVSLLEGGANNKSSFGVSGILCSTGLEESEFNVGLGS